MNYKLLFAPLLLSLAIGVNGAVISGGGTGGQTAGLEDSDVITWTSSHTFTEQSLYTSSVTVQVDQAGTFNPVMVVQNTNTGASSSSGLSIRGSATNQDPVITFHDGSFERGFIYFDLGDSDLTLGTFEAGGNPHIALSDNGTTIFIDPTGGNTLFTMPEGGGLYQYNFDSEPGATADATVLYSTDVASSSELFVKDEAANITQLSPHNAAGEHIFFSYNRNTKKIDYVNMQDLVADIEALTGKSYRKTLKQDLPAEYQQKITDMENHTPVVLSP